RRHRTWVDPARTAGYAKLPQPLGQQARGTGVVLKQFGLFAEHDQKREVLLAEHLGEELARRRLLDSDQVLLAAADVHQHADTQVTCRPARLFHYGKITCRPES